MNRRYVKSGDIESIGYDRDIGVMEVKFVNGGLYQYSGIEPGLYDGLMQAESKGSYLANYVKRGGYNYRKVTKETNNDKT